MRRIATVLMAAALALGTLPSPESVSAGDSLLVIETGG